MSEIADIEGIWIADNEIPVAACGCLVDDTKRKPGSPPQQFILKDNIPFKLVCWITAKESGRRLHFEGDLAQSFGTTSPLGRANWIDIGIEDKGKPLYVIWPWPKAANWKVSGQYTAKISLGYNVGQDYNKPPKWDPPLTFTFDGVNK